MVDNGKPSKISLSAEEADSKLSIISHTQYLSGTEDTLGEQALTAIENARLALNLLETTEQTQRAQEDDIRGTVIKEGVTADRDEKKIYRDEDFLDGSTSEVKEALKEVLTALTKSQERVKQLTLKNMFLLQHLNELQNGFKVEQNLAKQQFESMKYNLIVQKSNIQKQLESSNVKVSKYRETIIAKNREINRLSRLLNQGMVHNTKLMTRPNSMPSATVKKPFLSRQTQSPDSNMLNTLGLLASKVLKEEEQSPTSGSISNYSRFSHSPGDISGERSVNPDNTESDQSHDTTQILNQSSNSLPGTLHLNSTTLPTVPAMAPMSQTFQHIPAISEMRTDTNAANNDLTSASKTSVSSINATKLELPKLKTFNSVTGSVNEVL